MAAVWISSAPRRPRGGGATDTFQSNSSVFRSRCASGLRREAAGSKGVVFKALRCSAQKTGSKLLRDSEKSQSGKYFCLTRSVLFETWSDSVFIPA